MGATVPPSDKRSVTELRVEAARARGLARYLGPDEASRGFMITLTSLESEAEVLEAKDKS